MKFSIKNYDIDQYDDNCTVIVWIFESGELSGIAEEINKASHGYLKTLLLNGDLKGEIGQTLVLYNIPNTSLKRILLIGCGKEHEINRYKYKKIIRKTIDILSKISSTKVAYYLTELNIQGYSTYWKIRNAIEIIRESLYTFNQFKNKKIEVCQILHKIIFNISSDNEITNGELGIKHGIAITTGINATKDLGNMPPNLCNSAYLASKALQLADKYSKISTIIINEKQMKELGMNAYLAVGKGSNNESLMSIIKYEGDPNFTARPIILVGKGMTFDSGGISIKPADSMDEMKYDMCGAATVYGVMCMVIELNLPINIIGVMAGCENMVSGCSFRPGDILTTLSGKTVEILNTDAEGRLVLCDVLTYIERFNPEIVIDIATLTGACIIALGHHFTGLISNNNQLIDELINASKQSDDYAWNLPMNEEFQEQLKSNFADMVNIGGRPGGTITAGCFLSRFTDKYHWAHLDIAGTAWQSGKTKGATGRPVAMLSQFLLNRSIMKINN